MKTSKKVAILLVFYNSESHLKSLFESIEKQSFKDFRIYAIENSNQQTSVQELLKVFPDSVVLPTGGNIGFAKANNLLAEKALADGYENLFILNPDMELTDNTIEVLVNTLDTEPDAAACSSVLLWGNEKSEMNEIQLFGQKFNYRTQTKTFLFTGQRLDETKLPEKMHVDFVNGGSLLIRSEIVKQTGLFNENYFMYNDEIDLAFRIKKLNKKVVVTSNTKIYHHHDWAETNKSGYYLMYYYMMRNRVLFFKAYNLFFNLISDIFFQLITFPLKIKWLTGLADIKLVKFYYLGLWRGLMGETGKAKTEFK